MADGVAGVTADPIAILSGLADRLSGAGPGTELIDTTMLHIRDGLAIIAAGASGELAPVVARYLELGHRDAPSAKSMTDALLPRVSSSLGVEDAAFVMGCYAFADNYGDTSTFSVAHPNTVIVPALLATGQLREIPGRTFVTATIVGYQVMEFLGRAVNNGQPRMAHQLRGFRPTATAGPPAAAAAVAIGWDLPREVTDRAIAIACNFSGGLRRHSGGSLSPTRIQSGEAARAGVRAVLLAQAGLGAPANAFDGDGGFFDAFGAGPLDPGVAEYLGTPPVFAIESVDIKFHCTPYQFVTSLDCLLDIVDAFAPDPSTIERVVVSMPGEHASISKKASWSPPTSLDAAALDLQFCCAVVLITGSILWPSVLGAHLDDHETIELARKVAIVEGAVEDATFSTVAGSWPASASVTVIGAKTFDASLDRPRVTANDPSIRELVDAKCRHLLGPVTAEALRDLEGFLGSGDSFTAAARAIEREATFLPANRTVEGK